MIEQEGKEESFISDHSDSQLEIVSTDWRPMVDVEFTKERGKDRKPNMEVNLEEFISVKGISALGNQLTKDKINQISLLESLPYEAPEEVPADEIEVVGEETVSDSSESKSQADTSSKRGGKNDGDLDTDDKGQKSLF